jgi:hypothetical protein
MLNFKVVNFKTKHLYFYLSVNYRINAGSTHLKMRFFEELQTSSDILPFYQVISSNNHVLFASSVKPFYQFPICHFCNINIITGGIHPNTLCRIRKLFKSCTYFSPDSLKKCAGITIFASSCIEKQASFLGSI